MIDIAYGRRFNEGGLKDAKTEGAQQAFLKNDDGKGYTQEIAIPWKLLKKDGVEVKPGSRVLMTLEPNFVVGTGGRLDDQRPLQAGRGHRSRVHVHGQRLLGLRHARNPRQSQARAVRLADGREFPVKLEERHAVGRLDRPDQKPHARRFQDDRVLRCPKMATFR